jgi:DNA-binding NarL/FixJ family response regulator
MTAGQSLDLSEAESDILLMIALGYRSRVIADYLKLNLLTVDVHRRNLSRKFGVAYPENLNDVIELALFRGAMPEDGVQGFDSKERPCRLPVMTDPGSESSPQY